jgi:hypothetical protein
MLYSKITVMRKSNPKGKRTVETWEGGTINTTAINTQTQTKSTPPFAVSHQNKNKKRMNVQADRPDRYLPL